MKLSVKTENPIYTRQIPDAVSFIGNLPYISKGVFCSVNLFGADIIKKLSYKQTALYSKTDERENTDIKSPKLSNYSSRYLSS